MTFTLCPVTRADLPTFHTVMMAAGMDARSSWSRTTVADLEHSLFGVGAGGFLAFAGAEAVGCVGFRPDGSHTLTLNKLATLPNTRGQGIGAALVGAVEDLAAEQGYGRVLLAVSQFNSEVIPFYERLGYTQDLAAEYAHASPNSPKPVVLVKGLLQGVT
jgi:GNAT superfamily N-acetyltransferase